MVLQTMQLNITSAANIMSATHEEDDEAFSYKKDKDDPIEMGKARILAGCSSKFGNEAF